jgi:hypothetical protein
MIRYALRCAENHSFDSWFQSAAAFDALAAKGLVSCAVCGGTDVTKALMAPRVVAAEEAVAAAPARPLSEPAHPAEQMLRALREHLVKNSTYVGGRFAQEARAMHLGEADARAIHGEANLEEARALLEEGIAIAPLPILPPDKTN